MIAALAAQLREDRSPISDHVVAEPTGDFHSSYVVEAVREGYLLHYGDSRILAGHDDDLALLAGDYLYALGIRKLAESGDCAAVLRLANLISDCASAHAEGREDEVPALWSDASAAMADESQ